MTIKLLVFAHLQEQAGFHERVVESLSDETARELVTRIAPGLTLDGVRVALDQEYGSWDEPIGAAREIALIPPVSGG